MIHWYEETSFPIQTELFMHRKRNCHAILLWDMCVCVAQLDTHCKKSPIALLFKVWSGLLISLWSRCLNIYMAIFSRGVQMGLFSKYLSSWVFAAILSGESDAMLMWREVHKQHLEVLWCSQIQSAYINVTPNKSNLYQMSLYLCIFLSVFYFISFTLYQCFLSPVFFHMYIYKCVFGCVCGGDSVIVDRMITGLSVLSPQRKPICSKSQTHSPPSSNKVYYVSAVPYRSDDNHSGTIKAATEGTSESFGPWDAPTSKLTNCRTATKSQRGACSLFLQRKRGVNDP